MDTTNNNEKIESAAPILKKTKVKQNPLLKHVLPTAEDGSFRVHTPKLLNEIKNNALMRRYKVPVSILSSIIGEVALAAARINDSELNKLMLQLTLFTLADPDSEDFDPEALSTIFNPKTKELLDEQAKSQKKD